MSKFKYEIGDGVTVDAISCPTFANHTGTVIDRWETEQWGKQYTIHLRSGIVRLCEDEILRDPLYQTTQTFDTLTIDSCERGGYVIYVDDTIKAACADYAGVIEKLKEIG